MRSPVLDFVIAIMAQMSGREAQPIDEFERIAQIVAALESVPDLAKNFPDLVFDGIRVGRALFKTFEIRAEIVVDAGDEIIARQRFAVVEGTISLPRRGPARPAVRLVDQPFSTIRPWSLTRRPRAAPRLQPLTAVILPAWRRMGSAPHRENFLYFSRCGMMLSSPKRRFLSSS